MNTSDKWGMGPFLFLKQNINQSMLKQKANHCFMTLQYLLIYCKLNHQWILKFMASLKRTFVSSFSAKLPLFFPSYGCRDQTQNLEHVGQVVALPLSYNSQYKNYLLNTKGKTGTQQYRFRRIFSQVIDFSYDD